MVMITIKGGKRELSGKRPHTSILPCNPVIKIRLSCPLEPGRLCLIEHFPICSSWKSNSILSFSAFVAQNIAEIWPQLCGDKFKVIELIGLKWLLEISCAGTVPVLKIAAVTNAPDKAYQKWSGFLFLTEHAISRNWFCTCDVSTIRLVTNEQTKTILTATSTNHDTVTKT